MARTDINHFQLKTSKFHGIYRGVVEDNTDPEQLGRCKIRVWGLHDELKIPTPTEGIPTDDLPWSEVVLGLIEGSVTGAGLFSVPLQGSHVFLFFESGNWESPRYFASVPGQPTESADPDKGFNDPLGIYPREDRLGEPDFHRLARGITEETIVEWKNENLDLQVETATKVKWDEPESAYAAVYPKNIVMVTHRGITVEFDNTLGAERVHLYHPSNSYIEIDVDGNMVFRNEKDRFEITRGKRNKHILVDDNETIDFDKTSKVGVDETIDIGYDRDKTIGNNETDKIGQNWTVEVGGNIDITAGGDITIKGRTINLN